MLSEWSNTKKRPLQKGFSLGIKRTHVLHFQTYRQSMIQTSFSVFTSSPLYVPACLGTVLQKRGKCRMSQLLIPPPLKTSQSPVAAAMNVLQLVVSTLYDRSQQRQPEYKPWPPANASGLVKRSAAPCVWHLWTPSPVGCGRRSNLHQAWHTFPCCRFCICRDYHVVSHLW